MRWGGGVRIPEEVAFPWSFNRHEMGTTGFYSRKADSIAKVWMWKQAG